MKVFDVDNIFDELIYKIVDVLDLGIFRIGVSFRLLEGDIFI